MGYTSDDLNRPFVAVINTWGEVCPGHFHLNQLAKLGQGWNLEGRRMPFRIYDYLPMCDAKPGRTEHAL